MSTFPEGVNVGATESILGDAVAAGWTVIHSHYTPHEEPRDGMIRMPGEFVMVYLGWPGTRMGDTSTTPEVLLRWNRPPGGDWALACQVTLHTGRTDRWGDGILKRRQADTPEAIEALIAEHAPKATAT